MKRTALLAAVGLLAAGLAGGVIYLRWRHSRPDDDPAVGGLPTSGWVAKLREPDAAAAAEAVDRLVELGPDGMGVLLEARRDADLRAHRRAAAGLVRFGAAAAEPLVAVLPRGGARAEVALNRLGGAAVPALQEALGKPEGRSAARVLGGLGETARPAVPALAALLQDGGADVEARAAAAEALGRIGPEGADGPAPPGGDPVVSALAAALAGPPAVRVQAALALGNLGTAARPALPDLVRLARDRDTSAAAAGCAALGLLRAPEGAAALAAQLAGNEGTARAAAHALGQLGPAARPALPALITALKSPKEDSYRARAILERMGEAAVPALQRELEDRDQTSLAARRAAAGTLGLMGPRAKEAVPELLRALADPDPGVVLNAAQALVRVAPERAGPAVPALAKLLEHKEPAVADSAAGILADLGPGARSASPTLAKGLRSKDEKAVVRSASALGRIRPPARGVVDGLRQALGGPAGARWACVQALGRLGPDARDAVGELKKRLADPALRAEVTVALVRIDPGQLSAVGPALKDDLASPRDAVRDGALATLLYLDALPDGLAPALRPLLGGPGLAARVLPVVARLPVAEREKLLPNLVALLSSTDVNVRERAGLLLRDVPAKALPGLRQALASNSSRTRTGAAWTLRDPAFAEIADAPDALLACLGDADPAVRLEAAGVLAQHGARTEKAIEQALDLLASPDTDLRRPVVRALAGVPAAERGRVLPHLLECLYDPDEEVRRGAAWALGRLEKTAAAEKPLAALRAALADPAGGVRHVAAEALWRLEGEKARAEAAAVLVPLARAARPFMRTALLELLVRIDAKAARTLVPLVEADTRGDDVTERIDAALWLVRLRPEAADEVTALLTGILVGWDAQARYQAALGLEQLGPAARAALPALRRRLEVEDGREMREALRRAAAAAEKPPAIRP